MKKPIIVCGKWRGKNYRMVLLWDLVGIDNYTEHHQ
jgi:hypothetical protein